MEIKIIIPDDKLNDWRKAFKKAVAKPDTLQSLTDLEFFKFWLKDILTGMYKNGQSIVHLEDNPVSFDDDIMVIE